MPSATKMAIRSPEGEFRCKRNVNISSILPSIMPLLLYSNACCHVLRKIYTCCRLANSIWLIKGTTITALSIGLLKKSKPHSTACCVQMKIHYTIVSRLPINVIITIAISSVDRHTIFSTCLRPTNVTSDRACRITKYILPVCHNESKQVIETLPNVTSRSLGYIYCFWMHTGVKCLYSLSASASH